MDQTWTHVLVILVFYQKMGSAAGEQLAEEGQQVELKCSPAEMGSMIIWFRVLDKSGLEFIASFSNQGVKKETRSQPSSAFNYDRVKENTLILKSFSAATDSGVYSCASLVKGTELKFGAATRLVGEKPRVAQPTIAAAATQNLCTTATACVCTDNNHRTGESSLSLFCTPLILGPLVGSCGLLLLLLIIVILYCNKIRTRRCPHHHKRKPRMMPGGNK